jgi:hypothetical protein
MILGDDQIRTLVACPGEALSVEIKRGRATPTP